MTMKTLSQIFANRGDPWQTEREQEREEERDAFQRGLYRPGDTDRWLVYPPSGGKPFTVTDWPKIRAFKETGFRVVQVGWAKPERRVHDFTEMRYQFARPRREPKLREARPSSRSKAVNVKRAQIIQQVRRDAFDTPKAERYKVSWLDGRYSEFFWSKERAEEKRELLGKYVPNCNPIITVER